MRRTNSKLANGTSISPQLIIEQQTIKKLAEQIKVKLQLEQEKKREAEEKAKKEAEEKEKEKQKRAKEKRKKTKKKVWKPLSLFTKKGGITARRISANREFFYNKTAQEIESELKKIGYDTYIKKSNHKTSKAVIIEIKNHNNIRNIMQMQVSLDPTNWHKVPDVKISTNKIGIFKIVNATKKEYNGLNNEKAKIFFKINRKKNKRRKK